MGYIAPAITWSSGNNQLIGYNNLYTEYGGLLFDAYGSSGLNQSGSSNGFTGAIYGLATVALVGDPPRVG